MEETDTVHPALDVWGTGVEENRSMVEEFTPTYSDENLVEACLRVLGKPDSEWTEQDWTVIDKIADTFPHLLRNSEGDG